MLFIAIHGFLLNQLLIFERIMNNGDLIFNI